MDELTKTPLSNTTSPSTNINIDSPQQNQKVPRRAFNSILIVIAVICILLACFVFLNHIQKQNITSKSVSHQYHAQITFVPTKSTAKITPQTVIATSLDVPPLYPNFEWKEASQSAHSEDLMFVMRTDLNSKSNNLDQIRFKNGKFYTATTLQINSLPVIEYYHDQLKKFNWIVGDGSTTSYLSFSSFQLQGIVANGPCSGLTEYLGYKESMVRAVSIEYRYQPCTPPSPFTNETHIIYTVFISDPMSAQYFLNAVSQK
ncbi:MAG TPA: hypothetical protein VLF89_08580 [Candidatus Saccharimonadales bacterium]|nr:hypothetical protein [Candidatus Saccharimonadales bacterium]